jgi:hypothetical protein
MATLIAQILAQREDLPLGVIESYNASIKCGRSKISMADRPLRLLKSLFRLFSTLFMVDETQNPDDTVLDRLCERVARMTEALTQKELRSGPDYLSTVWLLNSLEIVYDQQQKSDIATAIQEKRYSFKIQSSARITLTQCGRSTSWVACIDIWGELRLLSPCIHGRCRPYSAHRQKTTCSWPGR